MTTDKEKLENLLERIDEILLVLKGISDDLRTVSASLKSMAVSQITHPTTQQATATPPTGDTSGKQKTTDDIRMSFPEDLENLLYFEDKTDYVMVKPKQFLGSENFAKIASAVRGMGGEYISAGRDSHFRVPKKRS